MGTFHCVLTSTVVAQVLSVFDAILYLLPLFVFSCRRIKYFNPFTPTKLLKYIFHFININKLVKKGGCEDRAIDHMLQNIISTISPLIGYTNNIY